MFTTAAAPAPEPEPTAAPTAAPTPTPSRRRHRPHAQADRRHRPPRPADRAPTPTPTPTATAPRPSRPRTDPHAQTDRGTDPHAGELVHVPDSIDATGSTDVTAKLQAVIDNAPNGSTIVFKAGGTYQLGRCLLHQRQAQPHARGQRRQAEPRRRTIEATTPSASVRTAAWARPSVTSPSSATTTTPARSDACCSRRANTASPSSAATTRSSRTWTSAASGATASTSTPATPPRTDWSDGLTFRDSTCQLTGRHGVGSSPPRTCASRSNALRRDRLHGRRHRARRERPGRRTASSSEQRIGSLRRSATNYDPCLASPPVVPPARSCAT